MGNLNGNPLPAPFTFATSLSIGDVEEVARRFRVSPPQTESDQNTKFGVNCTANYLKTILTGVVEGVFMASQNGNPNSASSKLSSPSQQQQSVENDVREDGGHLTSGVDVEALFGGFGEGKMVGNPDGWMSFEVKNSDDSTVPQKGGLPKINTSTINILPVLGALVVFAMPSLSNLDNHDLRLNLLFDVFYFSGTEGTMSKDDILLMAMSVFRGVAVFMKNSEFNCLEKDGEERDGGRNLFNVDFIEAFIVAELLGGHEAKMIPKEELVAGLKVVVGGLDGIDIEQPEQIFSAFSNTELVEDA